MGWNGPKPQEWRDRVRASWAKKRELLVAPVVGLYVETYYSVPSIAQVLNVGVPIVRRIIREHIPPWQRKRQRSKRIRDRLKGNTNAAGRKSSALFLSVIRNRWGENNPHWKGDSANRYTGHSRAARRFPLDNQLCARCDKPAQVRHHLDDNPLNNPDDGSNIEFLCRSCHMKHHLHR